MTPEQIVQNLNLLRDGEKWRVLDGLHAITKVTNDESAGIIFNPGTGLVVKTFLNETTGEIKLFPAKLFGFPENHNL